MPARKGFTLIEIIVALIIMSIIAAIGIPAYLGYVQQASARAAQNNLISIYNAQKTYYFSNAAYCTSAGAICTSEASINTNLSLNITDNYFTYSCSNASGFTCTATNVSDATFTMTVTGGVVGTPNPIVMVGGATCATPTGANPGCNPSCAYAAHPSYCPN